MRGAIVRIARPLVIAALAASLVAVGGTAASASTNSPQYFRYGQESFVLTTTSSAPLPVYWASASGVFNGYGVFVTKYSTQTGQTGLVAYIAGGSFRVKAQANGPGSTKKDWRTCQVFFTSSGTYQIFNGGGRLWGLRGWGAYYLFSVQTFPRKGYGWYGSCNFKAPPIGTFTIIHASGPVFLPRHRYYPG
jgi:hypothetical protein